NVGPAIRAARSSGIGMSAALVDLKGTAQGALAVSGTLGRTVVTGRVASHDLVLPSGASATASADLVYDEDTLGASTFALDTPGARVTGHVTMGMASSTLAGAFEGAVDSLPDFLAPWTDAAAVTGTARITGTIGGTTTVPDVPLHVTSTPIDIDGQRLGEFTGEARLVGTELRIAAATLDQGPGQLRASGRVDYESLAYDATLEGHGLTWTRPVPGVEIEQVAVDVSYTGAGTLASPGGSGSLKIVPSGGRVGDLMGTADVRWQFANGTAAITAFLPKLRALVQADVESRAPYAFKGTGVVSRLDVQPLALAAGALTDQVSGTVGFSASYQGTWSNVAAATAFVNLQDLDVVVGGLPVRLERPARVTVRADDFSVDDLALQAGTSTLTLAGRFRDPLDQPLRASLRGEVSDVVTLAHAFGAVPAAVSATGTVEGSWESRGGLTSATSTLSVSSGTLAWAGVPSIDGLEAHATFDGVTIAVDTLTAAWQGGQIAGRATVPLGLLEPGTSGAVARPGRVDLTVKGLTEKALAPWLPAATLASLTGRVSATLGLDLATADLDGVRGTLVFDEAAVTAAGVPIAQARPARLSMAQRVVSFDDVEIGSGLPLVVGGKMTFGATTALDLKLTGTPGLRPFSVLSPQLAVDGTATVDLAVTGTPAAPRFAGRIDLADAELVMRDPRVIASDITGPILFADDRITIPGLTGFVNGGDLEANGALRITGADVLTGDVTFQLRGVAIEYPRNVDSEIDALLSFTPGPAAPLLRGDVRVLRSSYRATISVPALVAFNRNAVVVSAEPTYLDGVRLDVSLSTEDDMIVDNNYGRFEAGANVRLQGTVARPGVTGRAELREGGDIFLLGGVYRVNASSIAFTNPSAIEPDMNISMLTKQGGGEVTVTLTGTLDRLDTSVTSSNPDANVNLLQVLLGGNTSLTGTDALALLAGDLLGVTGRALGLDALRVERGYGDDLVRQDPSLAVGEVEDTTTRLTLSKQVRSDVEVILSRDLGNSSGLTAVVSYRPWRNVELRATSRDNTDRSYAIRHELTFGGAAAATSTAAPRVIPDVAEVRIDGAPADDERALRARLKITAGKRFDFTRWRDDVERMQTWYRDRGFLEARVRASRAPNTSDGRLVLNYRVARGPRTELRITGTEVTARLRRELEQAWSDGVFDAFRLDEMRGRIAYDLVRRSVIGAKVEGEVAEADGAKVITIAVHGGQQVSSRAIEFEGATALTHAELMLALKNAGLDEYVWLDPLSTVYALKARYLEAGYREPAIAPELPRIEGERAVLHFAVQDGPITTMARVTVTGVSDDLSGSVSAIVQPLEGQAYRDAAIDDARRRIETIYRTKGFNSVVVSPSVAFADGHTADLTMDVAPGREQRLQDVVVDSPGRTRPSAIVNALRLEPGDPVDLTRWAQARKRVFDTNIFRQVDVRPEVLPEARADGAEAVRAHVSVTEWPTWRLRYGLQFNDTNQAVTGGDTSEGRSRGLGVVGDLQNRNVFGRAFTFGLYARAERRVQSGSTYLTFPTLFGRAVQTNVFVSTARADRFLDDNGDPLVRQLRSSISVEQRIRRGRMMEFVYGYRLIRDEQAGTQPDDPFFLAPITGRFAGSGLFDHRNDKFDPSRGWFSSVTVERVSEFVSNADSIKM
ncbi:MAG: translocation/assembly module TamB domain-containing protein, partial [Acidobacteriota bacterium]